MRNHGNIFDRRALMIAIGLGFVALWSASTSFGVVVPGAEERIDVRDIVVMLGGALCGPVWGAMIGFWAGLGGPSLYVALRSMLIGLFMGAGYWFIFFRYRGVAQVLGWVLLCLLAFFFIPIPLFILRAIVDPQASVAVFHEVLAPTAFVLRSIRASVPEFLLTVSVTTAVLAVLPRRFCRPFWLYPEARPEGEAEEMTEPSDTERARPPEWNARLLVAVGCGLGGFLVIVAKLHFVIAGTNALSDPREIFTCIGSALVGPWYGLIVGFLASVGEPNAVLRPYVIAQHCLAAFFVGWSYQALLSRTRSIRVILAVWVAIVFCMYYVVYLPGFFLFSSLEPRAFAELVGGGQTAREILPHMLLGWLPECLMTVFATAVTLYVLPRAYRLPFALRRRIGENDEATDRQPSTAGGSVLGLRLTLWFLLLSFVPLVVIGVFVRDDVTTEINTISARRQQEIARIFADNLIDLRGRTYQEMLDNTTVVPNRWLAIADRTGRYVANADAERIGTMMDRDFRSATAQRILAGGDGFIVEPLDGRAIGFASVRDENVAVISVLEREALVESLLELEKVSYLKLSMSLLLLSLAGGVVIWIAVGRPMRRLTWAAQEVGQGNLQAHVDARDMDDEIRVLANAFNEMTANLRAVHAGLRSEVGQRRAAEEALRDREQKFRLLAENASDMISIHDARGEYRYVSPSCRLLLGYEPEELVGKSAFLFIHEDDIPLVMHALTLVVSAVEVTPVAFRIRRKDGRLVWAESTVRINASGDEGVTELQVATRDISRRKQAEQALVESEERLRTVIANLPIVLFATDAQGIFTLSEGRGLEELGLAPGQLLGQSIFDVYRAYPDILRNVRRGLDGQSTVETLQVESQHFETWISPVREGPDGIDGIIGVATNVTDRLRMEEVVRESEAMYKALVEQSNDAIYVLQDRRLAFVNRSWLTMFGYAPEEVLSPAFEFAQLVAPESRGLTESRLAAFERGEIPTPLYEMRGVTKNGELLDLDVSTVRIEWNGRWAIQGMYRDVTERKRSEAVLLQTQKVESLGILAGGIAHDFNNLLQAMMGNLSLALVRLPAESGGLMTNLRRAESAAQRAAELTQQLLAYSGRGKFFIQQLDVNALIEENLHLLEIAVQKSIMLVREFGEGPMPILADAGQMQQVIMNLIINASEAIGERRGRITLRTFVESITSENAPLWSMPGHRLEAGMYVCLEVADDGAGMNPETLRRIFDPFFTTKFTGRGLGLSAVMGIVRGHHGGLQVRSELGRGTTFRIVFPRSNVPTNRDAAPPAPAASVKLEGTVLVIDDESDVREVVGDILEEAGMQTLLAPNGEAGIEIYRKRNGEITLVLLDLSMPGLGGRETFHRLKELDPDVRVIMSSGFSESEAAVELKEFGLAGFLQKPYRWDRLTSLIREILTSSAGTASAS